MQMIRDIMTKNVETIRPDALVLEAARKMRDFDTGAIPVCDGRKIRGMITDRDVVIRVLARDRDPRTIRVSDIMSPSVVYCYDDEDLSHAARLMQQNQIRRLVIVDRNKNLCGILSVGDLAVESGKNRLAGRTLEAISEPAGIPRRFGFLRASMGARPALFGMAPVMLSGVLFGLGYYFYNRRPEMVRDSMQNLKSRLSRARERRMGQEMNVGGRHDIYRSQGSEARTVA